MFDRIKSPVERGSTGAMVNKSAMKPLPQERTSVPFVDQNQQDAVG